MKQPEPESRLYRWSLLSGVVTPFILVAAFIVAVVEYNSAVSQFKADKALQFLERYNSDPVLTSRINLRGFVRDNMPEFLIALNEDKFILYADKESEVVKDNIAQNLFHRMVASSLLQANPETNVAPLENDFLVVLNFYEELSACVDSGLCRDDVSLSLFCRNLIKFYRYYLGAVNHLRERNNDFSIGANLQELYDKWNKECSRVYPANNRSREILENGNA